MQLINQRAKLLGKFTAKLFLDIFIITGKLSCIRKNRIKFAIDCKSDPFFQFETEFFLSLFLNSVLEWFVIIGRFLRHQFICLDQDWVLPVFCHVDALTKRLPENDSSC